jgi:hypothetical protein
MEEELDLRTTFGATHHVEIPGHHAGPASPAPDTA